MHFMLLKYNFCRASYLHLIKDPDSIYVGPCSSDFLKVETLLNNAIKVVVAEIMYKVDSCL